MRTRRDFLQQVGGCAAHLALVASVTPAALRREWAMRPAGRLVASEPFGRLEQVAEGMWALVSTPLGGDYTTVSNGGIIAGRGGVLVIEGLMSAKGATWLATQARTLTGRWPTHCVVTHYHSDHANGVAGYAAEGQVPVALVTAETRALVAERNQPADAARAALLDAARVVDATGGSTLDLGGRTVRLVPRTGHTASDVTVEVEDPSVVFCGDLVWNAMFPNYVDARPSALARSVAALRRERRTTYVPGHGNVATEADVARYVAMLGEVEQAARRAVAAGTPAAAAAAEFRLPSALGEWALFSPAFFPRAFEAWARDLQAR